jgi:hypothetical protein
MQRYAAIFIPVGARQIMNHFMVKIWFLFGCGLAAPGSSQFIKS